MKTSRAWVELTLKTLGSTQKELALRLGVSPTQISKWKSGEYMSSEMEEKFRDLVKVDDQQHPETVLLAGSVKDAKKWQKLIRFLAENAREEAETPYDTDPLQDDDGLLAWHTFDILSAMGVAIPKSFPKELESHDYDEIDKNPYSALISAIFHSLNDVWAFFCAYLWELIWDNENRLKLEDDDDGYQLQTNIVDCLIYLAACKVDVDEKIAPKFLEFRHQWTKDYRKWITRLKERAFQNNVPLKAELLDIVADSPEELAHTAEAEALGFNTTRLHPDIYMNELLVGMRIIHQVLPAILKKLEIDDFTLDQAAVARRTYMVNPGADS
jgi:transcriptional regulator with XRE-family HTH domain